MFSFSGAVHRGTCGAQRVFITQGTNEGIGPVGCPVLPAYHTISPMLFETLRSSRRVPCLFILLGVASLCVPAAWAVDYPPLSVEISPEHPLMLFQDLPAFRSDPERQKEHVQGAWLGIPESLQSHAMMKLATESSGEALKAHYDTVLGALQEPQIPTVIRIADDPQRARLDPALLEAILGAHTMAKGVEVTGLDFRFYDSPRMQDGQTPAVVDWLVSIIDVAARYGRFVYLPMNEVQWARVMSNAACKPLYLQMVACRNYVIPACLTRGDHTISNQSAAMGLWMEGAATNWGIAADIRWYTDANYRSPGEFGHADGPEQAPHNLYRAMVLNGGMTGATVYSFEHGPDLWFGPARHHWDESIFPTLRELVSKSVVARRDFVERQTRVALQLVPARNPEDFHLNLKDIDAVLDDGNLLRAAYGLERPGQIAELVPNRSDYFWIPFLSPYASGAVINTFDRVFTAGSQPSVPAWIEALAPYRETYGSGPAFLTKVGFGIFAMNTRENVRERQSFTIENVPVPVRQFQARRDGNTVILEWGFRENDLDYLVYKRVLPETRFTVLEKVSAETHQYVDPDALPDQTIAYAVTAQTLEMEPLTGTLDYGEYRTYSTTESRIAEEVVLTPLLASAVSGPISQPPRSQAVEMPWWPSYAGVPEEHRATADAIVEQMGFWEEGLLQRGLNSIMGVYATAYEDPQGWNFQYVRRAYQHLIERWRHVKMHRQIRRWDFANVAAGQVNVLMYCRFTGIMLTDSLGLQADIPVGIPRTPDAEVWVTWSNAEGVWRIIRTNPALPNFRELLSYDAGPYDYFPLGPDQF